MYEKGKTITKFVSVMLCVAMATTVLALVAGQGEAEGPVCWGQVNVDGFEDNNNIGTLPYQGGADLDGKLYVGTINEVTGGEIWRSPDGQIWEQVNEDGFGDPNNIYAELNAFFKGSLYAGTYNEFTGGQIWSSSDGTTWTQANTGGFGNLNTVSALPFAFKDHIYAGTENYETGAGVWRSYDGITWAQVGTDGFGDPNNYYAELSVVFEDYVYLGFDNEVTGAELWRSYDGITWEQVNLDGFGDPDNIHVFAGTAFDGYLYAGVKNTMTGGQIWRSPDGLTWIPVSIGGFGDFNNIGTYPYRVFEGCLYVGTVNFATGAEIWRTSDGIEWTQVNIDGFGDPDNFMCCVNSEFAAADNIALYCGTINVVSGGEIWSGVGFELQSIEMEPKKLNLKSKGKWITCYIELPEGYDVNDIEVSTVKISDINGNSVDIPAETHPTEIDDNDKDGIPDLMVKFDRSDVIDNVNPSLTAITVKGELMDGTVFIGNIPSG